MLHVPPDPVAIVIDYLAQQPDVVAVNPPYIPTGTTTPRPAVGTNLPNPIPVSFITVGLIPSGGGYRDALAAWSDEAHLDINCWATTERAASLLARTARAALMQITHYAHREGVIVDVDDLGGPGWLPDTTETPPVPRFIFSISITTHP